MQDNLEKFIKEHNEEFDIHTPREHMWSSINKRLERNRRPYRRVYYAAAASLLLIIGASIWFLQRPPKNIEPPPATAVVPEINKAEAYYASIVETKRTELNKLGKDYPELCSDLDKELASLDTMYGQLKTEYKNSNGNEAVLQAMMENMKTRVQLLSQQLQIIQNIRQAHEDNKQHLKSI